MSALGFPRAIRMCRKRQIEAIRHDARMIALKFRIMLGDGSDDTADERPTIDMYPVAGEFSSAYSPSTMRTRSATFLAPSLSMMLAR